MFQGHLRATDLHAALEQLETEGVIVRGGERGRGRPTTYWRLRAKEEDEAA